MLLLLASQVMSSKLPHVHLKTKMLTASAAIGISSNRFIGPMSTPLGLVAAFFFFWSCLGLVAAHRERRRATKGFY